MRTMLFLALVSTSLLGACTTIHQVDAGPGPDEFYAVANRSFLAIPGPSYILHCREISDPLGKELVCDRVLLGSEAGQLAPADNPAGHQKFVRARKGQ